MLLDVRPQPSPEERASVGANETQGREEAVVEDGHVVVDLGVAVDRAIEGVDARATPDVMDVSGGEIAALARKVSSLPMATEDLSSAEATRKRTTEADAGRPTKRYVKKVKAKAKNPIDELFAKLQEG